MNIKQVKYDKPDEYNQSLLELEISGNDIDYSLINSLRRTCYSEIPIYAFEAENIDINKNTSKDNNSNLRCTISQLPILNVSHKVLHLEDKYYKKDNNELIEKHPVDDLIIEYYLNVENTTTDNMFVSTKSIQGKINNKLINLGFNTPIVLSQLRPGENIELSMRATCCIGYVNGIFNASHTYYKQINENKFIFKVESYGQFDEYEILKRALNILVIKLEHLKTFFEIKQNEDKELDKDNKKFYIENENEITIGPVKYFLNKSKNIKNAGKTLYDGYMNDKILLYVEAKNSNIIYDEIYKAIDNSIKFYNEMNNKIKKL